MLFAIQLAIVAVVISQFFALIFVSGIITAAVFIEEIIRRLNEYSGRS